ncbi:MAG: hypothetical protein ACI4T1_03145 [Christensenellales bacterium]
MENKEQKKKQIQVGVVCHFQRDKRGRILLETTVSEPIYTDWTPELQAAEDKMFDDFARASISRTAETYLSLIHQKDKSITKPINKNKLTSKNEKLN